MRKKQQQSDLVIYPDAHMLPWSCSDCNFIQMKISPIKGDQKPGSCTETDSSIDLSISSTHLWGVEKNTIDIMFEVLDT